MLSFDLLEVIILSKCFKGSLNYFCLDSFPQLLPGLYCLLVLILFIEILIEKDETKSLCLCPNVFEQTELCMYLKLLFEMSVIRRQNLHFIFVLFSLCVVF